MTPKTRIILIMAALLIVSLACTTVTGALTTDTPAPIIPTNNSAPLPTDTPEPLPTDTAEPSPADTTEPLPTDTTDPTTGGISPMPGGEVLFFDDFSDPDSGWDQFSDEEGITDYSNGAYLIGVYTDTYFYWANPYQTFGDVVVKVDTEKVLGEDDMQYGIICRHLDVDNFYALIISGDGYAAIRKRYQGSDLNYIAEWVEVPAINTGNAANSLQAECVGNRLSLFVNGELAVEVYDSDIFSGDTGLMAGTFDQAETEVYFDNFTVQAP